MRTPTEIEALVALLQRPYGNLTGGERQDVATALTALQADLVAAVARAEAAEGAIKYVLDGYGLNEPHFKRQPEDDEDDWIVEALRPVVTPPADLTQEEPHE
jgi:hypothetical protein